MPLAQGDLLWAAAGHAPRASALAAPQHTALGQGLLAIGFASGAVGIWHCGEQDGALTHSATLNGHSLRVSSIAFSSAGDVLATGSLDCSVIVWRRAQMSSAHAQQLHMAGQRLVFSAPVTAVALSAAGDTLAVAHGAETTMWRLDQPGSRQQAAATKLAGWQWYSVPTSLAIKPDGSMLFTAMGG